MTRPADRTPATAGGGGGFGKFWVIGLVVAILTLGGLWAMSRTGERDTPANSGEIILDGREDEGDPAPRSETPRVTGEIIETPGAGGTVIGEQPSVTSPSYPSTPPAGTAGSSDASGGTIFMPPQPRPQPQQPAPQQPTPQQPAPQQPGLGQPLPQQPAPQPEQPAPQPQQPAPQPQQPAPQPQQPVPQPEQPQQPAQQPEGPTLLGEPAPGAQGAGNPAPPDTAG